MGTKGRHYILNGSNGPKTGFSCHYRAAGLSGILATLAAGANVYALRMPTGVGKTLWLTKLKLVVACSAAAAQEWGVDVYRATGMTVSPSAGTGAAAITPEPRSPATTDFNYPAANAVARIAGTDGITVTGTANAQPILSVSGYGAQFNGDGEQVFLTSDLHPEILGDDEGLIVKNRILGGGSGVQRVWVCAEFVEV